jgi:threonine aldolase
VVWELDGAKVTAPELVALARDKGVLINALGPSKLRLLTHLDVTHDDCVRAADTLVNLLGG